MAEDGAAQSGTTQAWPLPSFYFKFIKYKITNTTKINTIYQISKR